MDDNQLKLDKTPLLTYQRADYLVPYLSLTILL